MFERIKKAIMFKTDVYPEVARDKGFMSSAWIILIVSHLVTQLGAWAIFLSFPSALGGGFGKYILSVLVATVVGVAAFVGAMFVLSWATKQFFNMAIPWDDFFRPLALAQVFLVVGILALVFSFSIGTWALASFITWLASIAAWVASLFAIKTITGFDWGKTFILVLIVAVISSIAYFILHAIFRVGYSPYTILY